MRSMSVTEIQLYKSLKEKIGEFEAQELLAFVKSEINSEFMDCKQVFLVKEDKADLIRIIKEDRFDLLRTMKEDKITLMRTIYVVGLTQFLAIMAVLFGFLSFFLKR